MKIIEPLKNLPTHTSTKVKLLLVLCNKNFTRSQMTNMTNYMWVKEKKNLYSCFLTKCLRQNPINRKSSNISVLFMNHEFEWTKTLYQNDLKFIKVLLHFLKVNNVNNCLRQVYMLVLEKINFEVQRNCANTGKLSL